MDVHVCSWTSMFVYGRPCLFMDVHVCLWTSMFFMDVHKEHGIPRTSVDVHEYILWGTNITVCRERAVRENPFVETGQTVFSDFSGAHSKHDPSYRFTVIHIHQYNILTTAKPNERNEANPKSSILCPLVLFRVLAPGVHVFA